MPAKKARVRLFHWNEQETPVRHARLEAAGAVVSSDPFPSQGFMAQLRAFNPDAVVIDLSRAPARGRMIGSIIRLQKATRRLPLIFVEGQPEKVALVREALPDATFCAWGAIRTGLKQALAKRTSHADPVLPPSPGNAPPSRSLALKLGLKAGRTLALVDPPDHIHRLLEPLPEGAELEESIHRPCDYLLWFVRAADPFFIRLEKFAAHPARGLWIAWPKLSGRIRSELGATLIREAAHAVGLADAKICSIDADWSAMCFTRRKGR